MEKKNLFAISSPILFYFLYKYRYQIIGKKYRNRLFNKNMLLRFKDKYVLNTEYGTALGTIYPSNRFDIQKIFEFANIYKIPLIRDVNYTRINFPYNHCILDMSKYNDIIKFNPIKKRIRVESGITIDKLIEFLNKKNLTINNLEKYTGRNLTINDIFFNNFYGWKLQYDLRHYSVIIPKEQKIVKFNPFTDFSGNHIDITNLFLNNSYILNLLMETEFDISEKEEYNYFSVDIRQNKDINLKKLFQEKIIDDIIVIYNQKKFEKEKLLIQVKKKNSNYLLGILEVNNCIKMQKENIAIDEVYMNKKSNKKYSRHIIICIDQQHKKPFIEKFEKKYNDIFEKQYNLPEIKYCYKDNYFLMSFPEFDDINDIEKQYIFFKELNKVINKLKGNFFLNQNITIPNRFDQMREIGSNNFLMHIDIKQYFDPNYILNPHLSNIRPNYFELLKRRNKIINYICTKLKI